MTPAITFDTVSKYFSLERTRPRSFQELLVNFFRPQQAREHFWVLRDVSFELPHGQMIGFVGANGAGKSTALKLAARIIEPTTGTVTTTGRLSALLELGAGFHPDLTGRENIYLNGSFLGLDRAYLNRHLDAIIAFSELEQFIDVPVKYYSSGMYVRLGFAVAVHIEPEILLIDEVLAVGDANFQHKCMQRIAELRRDGVTIVLVTHAHDLVQTMCDQALWFDEGRLQAQGAAQDVVMEYLGHMARREMAAAREAARNGEHETGEGKAARRWGSGEVRITNVELCNAAGETCPAFSTGDPLEIRLHYTAPERVARPVFGLAIHHQNGAHICGPNTLLQGHQIPYVAGEGTITYRIPELTLLEGAYYVTVAVVDQQTNHTYDYHDRLYSFRVYRGDCRELYGLLTLGGSWHLENEAT